MKAFKAASYFSPHFVKKFKPECADLISLLNPFHLLHQQSYQSLKKNFQNMLFLQMRFLLSIRAYNFGMTIHRLFQNGVKLLKFLCSSAFFWCCRKSVFCFE